MKTERASIKNQFKGLYSEVERILFRLDPMGINFEDNTDEYDPEVDIILPRLKTANTELEVLDIIHEEFCRWFDSELVGNKNNPIYREIAKEVWSAWIKFSRPLA
ncbi:MULTISPECIES: hypothetical protein [Methylophaga]|uniref:Uncharacterized protein n=1 Tax=Methylophaga aminisulfidivorans MP TaxID=1026882 RepID=F5T1T6_9GAMM|nr:MULTISPECIES: hypothetical protein [Methylophaga]EGL53227.1 hypothetical protein MAMP_00633 [Methylophaga aminisulfidivorans MP]WVI84647.1 hypothetical protein VSX76_12800 [Methylophaga thalassica]